jgi:hypothetical protein
MARQSEAIEDRLERLKHEDHRSLFDSRLKSFRYDRPAQPPTSHADTRRPRVANPDDQLGVIVSLLEELSARIDGLERKGRTLTDEIRARNRRDQKLRVMAYTIGLACFVGLWVGRFKGWL